MRKKKLLLLFWSIILILAVASEAILVKRASVNWYHTVKNKEYGFEISYPRAYIDIPKEETNIEKITNSITLTVDEKDLDTGPKVDVFQELIHTKSNVSHITLTVEGLKKEKSEKTMDEICKDYVTMFKVFNELLNIKSTNTSEIEINGIPAGKVEIYVEGRRDEVYPGIISYLFSLDGKELIFTFTGTEDIFANAKDEIAKIVNSIRFEK